jgi:transcriptional regulator with XRE-family HTH domain
MGSTTNSSPKRQPLNDVFAANVRRVRTSKGLSVAALARTCGYTPDFVNAVENAEAPQLSIDELATFATALDVDVTDLVRRDAHL